MFFQDIINVEALLQQINDSHGDAPTYKASPAALEEFERAWDRLKELERESDRYAYHTLKMAI